VQIDPDQIDDDISEILTQKSFPQNESENLREDSEEKESAEINNDADGFSCEGRKYGNE
jgi:hypothetical protein